MRADALANGTAVAERIMTGPATARDLASQLGLHRNCVVSVVNRLRDVHGLPVRTEVVQVKCGRGGTAVLYSIAFPAGRVCEVEGCGTILRRSNPSRRCEVHGGGYLKLEEVTPMNGGSEKVGE